MASKGGPFRHRKVLRDNIQGVTKPALKRLIHRAGVLRASSLVYEELRGIILLKLQNIVRDMVTFTEHARRRTVQVDDAQSAIEMTGEYSALVETKKSRCSDREGEKSEGSTHRHKPGKAAALDVRYQQKNDDCFSISKLGFERLVREVSQDYKEDLRFEAGVFNILHQYIENYIVELVHEAGLEMKFSADRETLYPKDLQLVRRIRKERF